MIQSLQKFSQSRAAKIFLAVVALSFMALGGERWFNRDGANSTVAEVGPTSISQYELMMKVQEQAKFIMSQTQKPITQDELLQAGLPRQVLDHLVQVNLLRLEADRLGLVITDETLRNRIHSFKAFQDVTGVFDHARFAQVLQANGLSEDAFLQNVREEMIREQLSNAVVAGVRLPPTMIDPLFNTQYQHRQASILMISPRICLSPLPRAQKS